MIVGVGVDVCDVGRMARELGREGHGFRDQVFTPLEVRESTTSRSSPQQFALRFAAKEASLKALGIGLADTGVLRQVEVEAGGGEPTIRFHDRVADLARSRGVASVTATLTLGASFALAGVVLESADREIA